MLNNRRKIPFVWVLVAALLIALAVPTVGMAAEDPAIFNFEGGQLHGIYVADSSKGTATITNDASKAYAGSGSAKISFDVSNGQLELALDGPGDTIKAGSIVGMKVYIPSGVEVNLQPYVFGSNWEWNGQWYNGSDLSKDQWVSLTVKLQNGVDPSPRVGLQVFAAASTTGEIWIDSVGIYDESGNLVGYTPSEEPAEEEPAEEEPVEEEPAEEEPVEEEPVEEEPVKEEPIEEEPIEEEPVEEEPVEEAVEEESVEEEPAVTEEATDEGPAPVENPKTGDAGLVLFLILTGVSGALLAGKKRYN